MAAEDHRIVIASFTRDVLAGGGNAHRLRIIKDAAGDTLEVDLIPDGEQIDHPTAIDILARVVMVLGIDDDARKLPGPHLVGLGPNIDFGP